MAVSVRLDNVNAPFILGGYPYTDQVAVLSQDGARATVLAFGTVMAKIAATQKWEPFTNAAAIDGTAIPLGIYVGDDVLAATLVAGDVTDAAILVGGGGVLVDVNQLTIENSLTLATVIAAGAIAAQTVRDFLANIGIFVENTVATSAAENV